MAKFDKIAFDLNIEMAKEFKEEALDLGFTYIGLFYEMWELWKETHKKDMKEGEKR